jgi:hypothetical protein
MSSPSPTSLIGQDFSARIGEPWDFRSSAGDNCLRGVVKDAWLKDAELLVLCAIQPFTDGNSSISEVVLVNRYCKGQDMLASLIARTWTGANILYAPRLGEFRRERLEAMLGDEHAYKFLVGSVRLEGGHPDD